ncbi:MAG: LacI family transcriptional regulator [Ruminiclostridium sp.]|nr:LacI family transcriptional regulator [Ruminiclostridium sp.]
MPKLTIKEIAKLAGVSPSAVSIVLNNRKGVSDETRKKVDAIVKRMQYTPNPNSRRLLFHKTNNIAVLFKKSISPLEHLFHSELNTVIMHECETLGYNLLFAAVSVEDDLVILPNVIKSRDIDGIIFYGDIGPLIIRSIKEFDIPFIVVDTHCPDSNILSISTDYAVAAYTATKYLTSLGHTRIAYLGNSMLAQYTDRTFTGFKKAIEESKTALPVSWIQFGANDEMSARQCMENIFASGQLPTAVFCSADIYAIGAMKCLKSHSLNIPKDISVIGIDDIILSRYIDPSLTTIKIDKVEMGRIAIDLLIKKIEKISVANHYVSADNLIVRASTAIPGI